MQSTDNQEHTRRKGVTRLLESAVRLSNPWDNVFMYRLRGVEPSFPFIFCLKMLGFRPSCSILEKRGRWVEYRERACVH